MSTSASGPNGSPSFIETLEDRRLLSGVPPYAYGTDNDTAYGSDGTLHVAWYNSNAGSLNYASRNSSGTWSSAVTIDSIPGLPAGTPGVGQYVTLAVDSQNRPAVSYFDVQNGDLKFASRATGSWVIGTNVENTAALYPSLAFNGSDQPVLSYYIQNARDLKFARWTGSAWNKQTIDSADDVGRSTSLHRIPGTTDRFAIAYEKSTGGDFKFAEMNPGGNWVTSVVDTDPIAGGGFTSLDFDAGGNPAFSYYDAYTSTLKYASRSGSTWNPTGVSGRVSHWSNLWFDSTSKAHLVYYDTAGNALNHLTKASGSGSWNSANAAIRLGGGNYVSAAFKSDGTIGYTYGSPYADAVPQLGVGILAGNLIQQPAIPSNGVTVVSNTRIDLAWTYSGTSNNGFKVSISTDGGRTFIDERTITSASARSAQITGLNAATTYTFAVRAYNATGDSTFSNVSPAATTLVDPPAAPGAPVATVVSASAIDLSWGNVANETAYELERSLTGTGGWTLIASPGANVATYSDTGLAANTTYHYRVRATNAGGDSANATFAAVTTWLATPANFAATASSDTAINLTWSSVSGATGYTVQELDGADYVTIATVGSTATSYAVTGLTAETAYTFRLFATGANGNVSDVTTAGATTQATPADPDPTEPGTPLAVIRDPGADDGDGFGTTIAVSGNWILSANPAANGGLGEAVLIDATTGTVLRRFDNPASVPDDTDGFGSSVAIAGNRIAISAPDYDVAGTAKVYVYNNYADDVPDLILSGVAGAGTGFGQKIAAYGNDLLVQHIYGGADGGGEVLLYSLDTGALAQTFAAPAGGSQLGDAIAVDPSANTVLLSAAASGGTKVIEYSAVTGTAIDDYFVSGASGVSLAYSSSSVFIGNFGESEVLQYARNSTEISPVHTYAGSTSLFGYHLAVSGDRLLVTAPSEQSLALLDGVLIGVRTGAAYVYDHTTYAQVAHLVNPTPDPLLGGGVGDTFGYSGGVGVFGNGSFAIADPTDDDGSTIDAGGVYTFEA